MTITTFHPIDHRARLRALPSKTAQLDYACDVLDAGFTTADVRTWLSDHGVETERSQASKRVNAWRRQRGLTTTGELQIITPEMLASTSGPVAEVTGIPVAAPAPESDPESDPAAPEAAPVGEAVPVPESAPDAPLMPVLPLRVAVAPSPVTRGTAFRNLALLLPLLLVNTVAVVGQVSWGQEHLTGGLPVAILFAGALESIALFLAAETHAALMAGDSSALLRVASYAMAFLAGSLNYLHYAPTWSSPSVTAVAFGILSTVSPWLWGVRSRSMHRAELRDRGLIDSRAVRFAPLQWVLFPGSTLRAFRRAVILREMDPVRASALAQLTTEEYQGYLRRAAADALSRIAEVHAAR